MFAKMKKEVPQQLAQLSHKSPSWVPVQTNYTSEQVAIPDDFLTKWADDKASTVSPKMKRIDFVEKGIPEYKGLYACVIDNVLTANECATLVKLAEASAGAEGWRPALVDDMLVTDYRNSDRIIWDSAEIVARLWRRCVECTDGSLADDLAGVDGCSADVQQKQRALDVLGPVAGRVESWKFLKVNERMRFLRYGKGQFFNRHCDASYEHPDRSEHYDRTLYTLQLYLTEDGIKGGATTFWPPRTTKRVIEVKPKMGRVLIFQHRSLRHSGDEVVKGVKCTMRSDIMFRRQVPAPKNNVDALPAKDGE